MKDEYDFSNAKRGAVIKLTPERAMEKISKLKQENQRLEREIEILRQYGNKDCTAMADEVLAQNKEL